MIDKRVGSLKEAVRDIQDGATILVGGFGQSGEPTELVEAVADRKVGNLTIVSNGTGRREEGIARLVLEGRVRKVVCSFPLSGDFHVIKDAVESDRVAMELIPQGTLIERIRAGGAGLGGVLTPTGIGTVFAEGKRELEVEGKRYILNTPIRGGFALIGATRADRWGNLIFRHAARNFNEVMATAADVTIAQAGTVTGEGLPPDEVCTPGIFVDRVVEVQRPAQRGP